MSDGDSWPDEPDDPPNPGDEYLHRFDPETDPETDLVPDIPDEGNASGELFRAFWGLVATINLGLLAASLGAMLLVFRGQLREGGAALLVGVAALAYAGYKYRQVQNTDYDDDAAEDTDENADEVDDGQDTEESHDDVDDAEGVDVDDAEGVDVDGAEEVDDDAGGADEVNGEETDADAEDADGRAARDESTEDRPAADD
ncbi:MAG: hypothetical protein ABEJ05_07785 [Haloglomus sp.]